MGSSPSYFIALRIDFVLGKAPTTQIGIRGCWMGGGGGKNFVSFT